MTPEELKQRTRAFAVAVIKFAQQLPTDPVTVAVVRQLSDAAARLGHTTAHRAGRSPMQTSFPKMTTTEEEADEAQYWLEVLVEAKVVRPEAAAVLLDEADQLVRIIVASIKTKRARMRHSRT